MRDACRHNIHMHNCHIVFLGLNLNLTLLLFLQKPMVGSNEALNNLSRINPTHDVIVNQIKALVSASLGAISEVRIGKYMPSQWEHMLSALHTVWLDLQRAKANIM